MTRILIVGIGALGGTMATRAINAGIPVWLATLLGGLGQRAPGFWSETVFSNQ